MILRRVIQHVKKQEWTAIWIDLVIVVVGVFIGIQVSNWNQARGDRKAEIGYLHALEGDIKASIGKLEILARQFQMQQEARAALYAYSHDANATLEPVEIDRLILHGLFQLPQIDIDQTTFETLKSSGALGSIGSPALVSGLQVLSASVAEAFRSQADEYEVTYRFSDPLLLSNFEMERVFTQPNLNGDLRLPWLKAEPRPSFTPAVMKDVSFRNVIAYRSYFTEGRLATVHKIVAQHRKIAELIDARQSELGATE